jgi:hypothetical protein
VSIIFHLLVNVFVKRGLYLVLLQLFEYSWWNIYKYRLLGMCITYYLFLFFQDLCDTAGQNRQS